MAAAKRSSPTGLTLAASISLSLILVVAGVSTVQLFANGSPALRQSGYDGHVHRSSRGPGQAAAYRNASDDLRWIERLYDSTCDDICVGGSACSTTGNKPCPSKFTCVLGNRDSKLELDMPLDLHLASLVGPENALDLCQANLFVCFTPASSQTNTCVPTSDPCRNDGRANLAVPIITRDLVTEGIDISIRRGSSNGSEIATGTIRYGTPIRRIGLCSGFKFGGLTNAPGSAVKYVTFFVEPRHGSDL